MRACPLLLYFDYSSNFYRSRILASATSQAYFFRLRTYCYFTNASTSLYIKALVRIINKKFVISNHHVRGEFITRISWGTITKSRQTRYAQTCLDFYCSSHSFAKTHKLTCCLLITQFHTNIYTIASKPCYIKALRKESSYSRR